MMGGEIEKKREHLLCLLPFPESDEVMGKLKKEHPNLEVTYKSIYFTGTLNNHDLVPDELWEGKTILSTLAPLPPPHLAHQFKFIHFNTAGTNHVETHPIYTDTNIPLTTSSGIHGPPISEWVLLQILSNSKRQKTLLEWQRQHRWASHTELGALHDSVGMRLGVLGYGSIGRQTARVCKAMGMDVIAYTASPRKTPESKRDTGYVVPGTGDLDGSIPSAWYSGLDKESLHEFLKQDIDVLLIAVPLTKETLHFIGAEELKILGERRNTFIVNISRGSIIKQDELILALKKDLKDGGLRGAALDVTDPEPLNEDNEIWDLENVAITPHVSSISVSYVPRAFDVLSRNITNLEEGKPFINVVNRKRGY